MKPSAQFTKFIMVFALLVCIAVPTSARAICILGMGDCEEASAPPPEPPPPPPQLNWQAGALWPYRLPFFVYTDLINYFCYPVPNINETVDPTKCAKVSENCVNDYCGKCVRDRCNSGQQFNVYKTPYADSELSDILAVFCSEDPLKDCTDVCTKSKANILTVFPECAHK